MAIYIYLQRAKIEYEKNYIEQSHSKQSYIKHFTGQTIKKWLYCEVAYA